MRGPLTKSASAVSTAKILSAGTSPRRWTTRACEGGGGRGGRGVDEQGVCWCAGSPRRALARRTRHSLHRVGGEWRVQVTARQAARAGCVCWLRVRGLLRMLARHNEPSAPLPGAAASQLLQKGLRGTHQVSMEVFLELLVTASQACPCVLTFLLCTSA
jgi:hypothetical protein